jgi:magnesium transporter
MAKKNGGTLQEFRGRGCTWIHLGQADAANLRELGTRFTFHEHDLREVLPALQHTKCIVRPQYIFMVLLIPVFDQQRKALRECELDIFLNATTLVTVNHGNELTDVVALLDDMMNASRRELILSQSPAEVIINLIDRLYKSTFPMLVQLSREISEVESRMFGDYERENTIDEVLQIKTSNQHARRAMMNHRNVLIAFKNALPHFTKSNPQHDHLDHVIQETTNIWNTLESQRESANTLHETNQALLSYRVNEIMKTLTIIAVIVFPLTLIAAVFGMNTVISMPFVNDPNGFWIVLAMMFGGAIIMLSIFKAKKWL